MDLADQLAASPPFDSLERSELEAVAAGSTVTEHPRGELILDAFRDSSSAMYVVLHGAVDLWIDADRLTGPPDESVGPGGIFGFSALLAERSIGPRAVAATAVRVARVPGEAADRVFTTKRGARFLAEQVHHEDPRLRMPAHALVGSLLPSAPTVVPADTTVADAAREMGSSGSVIVELADGFGLVTDASLRRLVLLGGLPGSAPAGQALDDTVVRARPGQTVDEVLVSMLERDAEHVLVETPGAVLGTATRSDLALAAGSRDLAIHAQLRAAASPDELVSRVRGIPSLLDDLLRRGLATGRVIALYTALVEAAVLRAIELTLGDEPDLDPARFTWFSLGSIGRREALLSSDIDSAVAFDDDVTADEQARFRAAFARAHDVLARAGLIGDPRGTTAANPHYSRTFAEWSSGATGWAAHPERDKGAIMTSLLLDGRPILGGRGMPEVEQILTQVRCHRGTMLLLLTETLSHRARLPHGLGGPSLLRRPTGSPTLDLKADALLPVVNIARWVGLGVGSAARATPERLVAAAGGAMLPEKRAQRLVEVFDVLQRMRLRYQLLQFADGVRPTDQVTVERLSPIDRSIVAQCVREINGARKRMANIAQFVPPEQWQGAGR